MNTDLTTTTIFVIHVSEGYEERKKSIDAQAEKFNLNIEYILDGDIKDLNKNILDAFFTPDTQLRDTEKSCAYKHTLAMQEILNQGLDGALIIEDDFVFYRNCKSVFTKALKEAGEFIKSEQQESILINFERGNHYIPLMSLRPKKYLYRKEKTKMASCYYVTKATARLFLDTIHREKINLPADWLQTHICSHTNIPIFWSEPPMGEQGSKTGLFSSELSNRKVSLTKQLTWKLSKAYKTYIRRIFLFK